MQVVNFNYKGTIRKLDDDIEVVAYNSPYERNYKQSVDDVKEAVLVAKVVDIKDMKTGDKKDFNFLCRFIENQDGTFNQIFI